MNSTPKLKPKYTMFRTFRRLAVALLAALGALSTSALAHGAAPRPPESSAPPPSGSPVRLVWANMTNHGCSSCEDTYGVIEVIHAGSEKEVDVFYGGYESSSSTAWPHVRASRLRSVAGNRELWAFKGIPLGRVRMAIRLRTGGQEYWDNNGGRNYELTSAQNYPSGVGMYLAGPGSSGIVVREATITIGWRSSLNVKMIGPAGADSASTDAAIVYSTDGWFTTKTAVATRTSTFGEFQEWSVDLELPWREVSFAAVGHENGVARWDNAYGKNFFCGQPGPFEASTCTGGALLPRELSL
jgi:hypothetical protein